MQDLSDLMNYKCNYCILTKTEGKFSKVLKLKGIEVDRMTGGFYIVSLISFFCVTVSDSDFPDLIYRHGDK